MQLSCHRLCQEAFDLGKHRRSLFYGCYSITLIFSLLPPEIFLVWRF